MDKETLSNYGWIVICVLVLAVMIALAGPFGNFVSDAVKSTTQGLFDTNQNALDAAGITIEGQNFDTTDTNTDNDESASNPAQNPTDIKVQGGAYAFGDYNYTVISPRGNEFGASTIEEGREIAKAQYMQEMNMTWEQILAYLESQGVTEEQAWASLGLTEETFEPYTYDGWKVSVIDKTLTTYGNILNSINGKPILSMDSTFSGCESMITAPKIPSTVNSMYGTFSNCIALENAPDIPNGVTNMNSTFSGCKALKAAPQIPTTVTNMGSTFAYCQSLVDLSDMAIPASVMTLYHTFQECRLLEKAPVISNGLTEMYYTFYKCESLKKAPIIPSSVKKMEYTFGWCTALTEAPTIPVNVNNMSGTFYHCISLEKAPIIPQGVTNLSVTFRGCESLKSYVGSTAADGDFSGYIIPNSVTALTGTFYGCTALVKAPAIPTSVTVMRETFNNCTNLTTAPTIPSGVTDLYQAFQNCTSLTGVITINGTPTGNLTGQCFKGVDFETQNITLAGASTRLDDIGATGTNYCAECNGKCQGSH